MNNTNPKTQSLFDGKYQLNEPLLVSTKEACRLLGIGNTTLYALVKSDSLAVVRIGRRTLVTMVSIKSLIEKNATDITYKSQVTISHKEIKSNG